MKKNAVIFKTSVFTFSIMIGLIEMVQGMETENYIKWEKEVLQQLTSNHRKGLASENEKATFCKEIFDLISNDSKSIDLEKIIPTLNYYYKILIYQFRATMSRGGDSYRKNIKEGLQKERILDLMFVEFHKLIIKEEDMAPQLNLMYLYYGWMLGIDRDLFDVSLAEDGKSYLFSYKKLENDDAATPAWKESFNWTSLKEQNNNEGTGGNNDDTDQIAFQTLFKQEAPKNKSQNNTLGKQTRLKNKQNKTKKNNRKPKKMPLKTFLNGF